MMTPETRPSLLMRVRDSADHDAWQEFSEIYRPVICRLAAMKGLQDADAEDLSQKVMLAISQAISRWEPDANRAKFRTWLKRIASNAILNALTRGVPDVASGQEAMRAFLEERPANDGTDPDLLNFEYRRQIFGWAAEQIRVEFTEDTWLAFWRTAIDDQDVQTVARQLGRTRGSVYASRSRVMKRLKQVVEEFNHE